MFPKSRSVIARVGLGFALWFGVMGQFISFVPGGVADWFGTAAVFATLGLLSLNWRVRAVATVLIIGLTWFAWLGYQHGQRYQEWLSQQQQLRQPAAVPGDKRGSTSRSATGYVCRR